MKAKFVGAIGVLGFALAGSLNVAHADLITFDDPVALPGTFGVIPNGYAGLNWGNFFYIEGALNNPSGYNNGTVSSPNVAFNSGNPATFSVGSGTFTLNNFDITAAWNNGLNVQVTGLLNGVLQDITTFTIDSTSPTFVTLNWSNINEVDFVSSGGTNAGFAGAADAGNSFTQFALDNVTLNAQGAPGPVAGAGLPGMMMVVVAGLLGWRRMRKNGAANAAT